LSLYRAVDKAGEKWRGSGSKCAFSGIGLWAADSRVAPAGEAGTVIGVWPDRGLSGE